MRVLEHIPLRAQVAQDLLASRNVLIQCAVRVLEESLLPQCVRFSGGLRRPRLGSARCSRVPEQSRTSRVTGATAGTCCRRSYIGVRVLWSGSREWSAAEQLSAVSGVLGIIARGLEVVELITVFC